MQYVKDNGMDWTHAFLGKWTDDTVTKAYGVRGIPATFLIGPDGRVLARDLRGEIMLSTIRRALASSSR
jgi:hypothetical protein